MTWDAGRSGQQSVCACVCACGCVCGGGGTDQSETTSLSQRGREEARLTGLNLYITDMELRSLITGRVTEQLSGYCHITAAFSHFSTTTLSSGGRLPARLENMNNKFIPLIHLFDFLLHLSRITTLWLCASTNHPIYIHVHPDSGRFHTWTLEDVHKVGSGLYPKFSFHTWTMQEEILHSDAFTTT